MADVVTTEPSRITLDPKVLLGKPVIRGTRLSVEFVIGLMAEGWSEADILANYPGITREDITACAERGRAAAAVKTWLLAQIEKKCTAPGANSGETAPDAPFAPERLAA